MDDFFVLNQMVMHTRFISFSGGQVPLRKEFIVTEEGRSPQTYSAHMNILT